MKIKTKDSDFITDGGGSAEMIQCLSGGISLCF